MKYSYKILKSYLKQDWTSLKIADDIILHLAEVEKIHLEGENLKDIYIGKVLETRKHTDSEKLNICRVEVLGQEKQIVCGASNVKAGLIVPVAIIGANLGNNFVIEKCKIRGEISEGMICSEDELGLVDERQDGILELPNDANLGISMREYLGKDDEIIEIDNKGINHRPDLFSYIGLIRELAVINGENTPITYEKNDFSNLNKLNIRNDIKEVVKRYVGLKLEGVSNIESPRYIKNLVEASGNSSKGLLIDISNYSLFLYGQPTHCFDADKITGNIVIRYAKNKEEFLALDGKKYELNTEDIVIADSEKVLALGGVIGGSISAVSENTKNIIIEGAWFNPKTVRKTGRRHGIRTDSLNIFEKDIPLELPIYGVSLICRELKNIFPNLKLVSFEDIYDIKQEEKEVIFDLDFINNLIGARYTREESIDILERLGLKINKEKLIIPFWRKDLNYKADIAEEIARINGFDLIEPTIPRINLGAIIQDNIYKLKNDVREFFVDIGYYDLYNYSFVNAELMAKLGGNLDNLVSLKNSLTEDMTHMRGSLIPNLLLSIEKNIKQKPNLKLFEFEKVFNLNSKREILENYNISGLITSSKDIIYYDLQNTIRDLFKKISLDNYIFSQIDILPSFAHAGRTASIIARGQQIGFLGEIHPAILSKFSINTRVGFFEIDADKLKSLIYNKIKARDVSQFQENNFDLSFVVDKKTAGKTISIGIQKTDPKYIQKVELFDIYENEDTLPGKRSLSFKIFIQSYDETLSLEYKNNLIKQIVEKVGKLGGVLR